MLIYGKSVAPELVATIDGKIYQPDGSFVVDPSHSTGKKILNVVGGAAMAASGLAIAGAAVLALPAAGAVVAGASAVVVVAAELRRLIIGKPPAPKEDAAPIAKFVVDGKVAQALAARSKGMAILDKLDGFAPMAAAGPLIGLASAGAAMLGEIALLALATPVGVGVLGVAAAAFVASTAADAIFQRRVDALKKAARDRGVDASRVPLRYTRSSSPLSPFNETLAFLEEKLSTTKGDRSARWISGEDQRAALEAIALMDPAPIADVAGKMAARRVGAESIPAAPAARAPTR